MKEPAQLVFIPSPGIGHIVSTVEIAKLLVSRDDQLFITVLVKKLPHDSKGTDAYIESFSESCSSPISQRIQFINLPNVETTHSNPRPSPLEPLEDQKPHVRDIVGKLTESRSTRLAGFVVDMFCVSMIDVANEFGVPIYLFFTSGAGALGLLFELQALRDHDHKFEDCADFVGPDSELVIPNFLNPLPLAKVILGVLLEKEFGNPFLNQVKKYRETKGILVNSFMELESHVLQALLSNTKVPPVYPVGPMLKISNDDKGLGSKEAKQKSDILEWLDDQPPSSVVFLCFGSMGCFNEDQVREIARALEQAGYRFLWSLRRPPPMGNMGLPSDYEDFTEVLPQGFLERTLGIGKVIGWAPQTAVLAHPAVGGFVSHCGWNSTLESLWHGVPIATWPLYAEQQINAFELVKELGLAVEIDMSYRKDNPILVNATKIEKGIKEVMELDSDIRTRVKEMSDKCKKALMVGGSSYSALGHFIDHI